MQMVGTNERNKADQQAPTGAVGRSLQSPEKSATQAQPERRTRVTRRREKRQNMGKNIAPSAPLPPLPSEIYAVFNGPLDQEAVTRIFNGLTAASANSVKQFHLLFQSEGGGIGEGVTLYNLFRTLPFDLTLYNTGTVASIATIAYLGAKKRKASAHALFMIHRTETTTQFANTQTVKSLADSAVLNDQRTEAILRQHITIPSEKWHHFDLRDILFTAEEAVKAGISDEIREFSPPAGTRIFNV
jgi:ATP-dependent Clp protease protease subunit